MKILKEIGSWVGTFLIAIVIALLINLFVFRPSEVLGSSMEPTLKNGDIGMISRISHTFNIDPDYGDIVIIDSRIEHKHSLKDDLVDSFKYNVISSRFFNQRNHNYWIKRVIGKEGDTLEFKDGKAYRNGKLIKEDYIKEKMNYSSDTKIVVPKGHVYVLGDNRNSSMDSRVIGPVPLENVIGKLIFKF